MKPIKIDLPKELKSIEIIDIADLHIGDMMSDWEHIQELLKYVKDTQNCYCILGGDLMDTAISASIGDTYGANVQPMHQLEMCVKLFEPIKDKILCVLHGNHENRVYKSDGLDMTQIFCNQLGIGERYSATTALLFISFGNDVRHKRKETYLVYATHGSGGGRKEGGKINRLVDLAEIVDADLYFCAHTHLPATLKTGFYRASPSASSVSMVTHTFINTAAALDYGGYGDVQGYKPSCKDYPIAVLDGLKKKITVRV